MTAPASTRSPSWTTGLFWLVFAALALYTTRTIFANPIGPGVDFNYHLMSASLTARGWVGDPAVTSLYHRVNPLHCNTLLYTLVFPFELLFKPVDAFKIGTTLYYFVGFPAACAAALAILRRPLWGALLGFPLCYVITYWNGGFMPFVSAAPFFVLAIAMFHRVHENATEQRVIGVPTATAHRDMRIAMVVCVAAFLAHGHLHAWLMVVLAFITLCAMIQTFARSAFFSPMRALGEASLVGARAFAVVAPSLACFAYWYLQTHYGVHATKAHSYTSPASSDHDKMGRVLPSLIPIRNDDADYTWVMAFGAVLLIGFVLSQRKRERLPSAEIAFLISAISFFVLPWEISGQTIAIRQFDIALWLLPLVVYPKALERAPVRNAIVIGAFSVYAFGRMAFLAKHLRKLQVDVVGLFEMAKPCPPPGGELAYVTFGSMPDTWNADSLHQSHETFGAMCKIDVPVYDATIYPHNLLALRYKGALPAPVKIMVSPHAWYSHPRLFSEFNFVLVRNWSPSATELEAASAVADRIRLSRDGKWQLWKRKAPAPAQP